MGFVSPAFQYSILPNPNDNKKVKPGFLPQLVLGIKNQTYAKSKTKTLQGKKPQEKNTL